MNGSCNHIKHFIDTNKVLKSKEHRPGCLVDLTWLRARDKYHAKQLDDKQRHTGFNYYEYDMPKFGTPS